jgi:hypothetical protein
MEDQALDKLLTEMALKPFITATLDNEKRYFKCIRLQNVRYHKNIVCSIGYDGIGPAGENVFFVAGYIALDSMGNLEYDYYHNETTNVGSYVYKDIKYDAYILKELADKIEFFPPVEITLTPDEPKATDPEIKRIDLKIDKLDIRKYED